MVSLEQPVNVTSQQLKNSDFKDMFDLFRRQMEHEDTLVNHRINFSTVVQGALITAFIFVGQAFPVTGENEVAKIAATLASLRTLFCIVGIALVIYALIGILAAIRAWQRLSAKAIQVLTQWERWTKSNGQLLPIPDLPYGGGSKMVHFFGTWFGPFAFVMFGVIWVILLYHIPR